MKVFVSILVLFFVIATNVYSQKQDNVWLFGDGVKIDFDSSIISNMPGTINSSEACASISDKHGELLFYSGGNDQNSKWGCIWNSNGQIMQNGDSINISATSTQGVIIIPFPNDTNKYYVFTTSSWFQNTNPISLYYSIVDLSLNNGYGSVINKNVLVSSDSIAEKISVVKHANGRDWWLITHSINSNIFYKYLITSQGLSSPSSQSIGFPYSLNFSLNAPGCCGEMVFSQDGETLVALGAGVKDLFKFDRCSGLIYNYQDLMTGNRFSEENRYYGASFSKNSANLYISNIASDQLGCMPPCPSKLEQFNLNSSNVLLSMQIISSIANSNFPFLQHQLSADGRIFIVRAEDGTPVINFDSVNTTLSVINFPDSIGSSSDFQINSFSLNGNRTYMGLPNMPNYNLGRLVNSPCDTLGTVSLAEVKMDKYNLSLFYDKYSQVAFVNAKGLKGKQYKLEIFNVAGQLVLEENGKLDSEYYTSDVALTSVGNGMYIVRLSTEKEVLTGKFVKY
jgi:hypothetical protein